MQRLVREKKLETWKERGFKVVAKITKGPGYSTMYLMEKAEPKPEPAKEKPKTDDKAKK